MNKFRKNIVITHIVIVHQDTFELQWTEYYWKCTQKSKTYNEWTHNIHAYTCIYNITSKYWKFQDKLLQLLDKVNYLYLYYLF